MISRCYFELRTSPVNLTADMMRHLHTRQYLGKTLVIGDHPASLMQEAYKQWLKLSRAMQRQRLATADADKILKYTHTITHMQHVQFIAKSPFENPEADVYFVPPHQLDAVPMQCFTVYVTSKLSAGAAQMLLGQLPAEALIVDYQQRVTWSRYGLAPKHRLELQLHQEWCAAQEFLAGYHIALEGLFTDQLQSVDAMDNALDTLLSVSRHFLQTAERFNRALELARPHKLSKQVRQQYDTFTLLAHRVQALATPNFTQQFLETYGEDDTFFLQDAGVYVRRRWNGERLADAIAYQLQAGRHHLAQALRRRAGLAIGAK